MRGSLRPLGVRALAVSAVALLLGPSAGAATLDPPETVLLSRAQALHDGGHCEAALPVLAAAAEHDPSSGRAALLTGRCLIELGRYPEAAERLSESLERSSPPPETALLLAVARYHAGDVEGALRALELVPTAQHADPEYDLYRGLILLGRGDPEAAAQVLARARDADPMAMEPIASYYEGVAWAAAEQGGRARTALERVIELDTKGEWGRRARAGLRRMPEATWFQVTVGLEHDSNVILRGQDVSLPTSISDQRDERVMWRVAAGHEAFREAGSSGGIGLSYLGSAHRDLDEFDTHYPTVSLWLDRRLGESGAGHLQYDLGQAWVDGKRFLLAHTVTPALSYEWAGGASTLFARGYWHDYHFRDPLDVPSFDDGSCPATTACGPPGIDEGRERQRDGRGLSAGIAHGLPVAPFSAPLQLGYAFHLYQAHGSEYDFRAHELSAAASLGLPGQVDLSLRGSYTYRPFAHASTFPDPDELVAGRTYALDGAKRRDNTWTLGIGLARELRPGHILSVRSRWIREHSSVEVYDHDRWIAGLYYTVSTR